MNDNLNVGHVASVEVVRPAKPNEKPNDKLNAKGRFQVEHWRNGKLIGEYDMPNAITDQGRQKLLDVMFDSATHITAWYMGLVDSTGYTALAAADVYAQIGGTNAWSENDHYTDTNNSDNAGTRPAWGAGASSVTSHVASTTNATAAIFTVTSGGSGTIKGLFIVGGTNSQTKDDATSSGNFLWSAALFTGGDVTVIAGDQLKVTYTVSA